MDCEGRGKVAPRPITVKLTRGEKIGILIDARRIAARRGEWHGEGWKGGLAGELVVRGVGLLGRQLRPIYLGLGGEYSTAKIVNRRIGHNVFIYDTTLYADGDGGIDMHAYGMSVQIKTRGRDGDSLIRRLTAKKSFVPMESTVAVFCEWNGNDPVKILGWHTMAHIMELCPLQKSPVADHWNLCVRDSELQPIGSMITELRAGHHEP